MGLQQPLDVPTEEDDETQNALCTLNSLLYCMFPQISSSDRATTFQPVRPFSEDDLDLLENLAPDIEHDGIRARAYEILWALRPGKVNPNHAIEAAKAYLKYFQGRDKQDADSGLSTVERALRLSGVYARHPGGHPIYIGAQQQAFHVVQDTSVELNVRCTFLNMLISTQKKADGTVPIPELLSWTAQLAEEQLAAGNHVWRSTLAQLREELASQCGPVEKQAARENTAQVLVDMADANAQDNPIHAKKAYMNAERLYLDLGMRKEAQRMQLKGHALTPAIVGKMKPMYTEADDFKEIARKEALQLNQLSSLEECLKKIASYHAVYPQVENSSQSQSLSRLFGQFHLGVNGEVVNSTGKTGEVGFTLGEMQQHAQLSAMLNCHLWSATGARWTPEEEDISALVKANPAVPSNYSSQVTVGLIFALHNDYLVAASMLAPMPEAIFRRALQSAGKLAPYTTASQSQMQTTLGTILEPQGELYPELERMFGKDLMADAKRVLDTESLNVRNTMLHGLGNDQYTRSWPGLAMIQLVFRLAFAEHPGWQKGPADPV
ncbi:hypothetical protein Deipr_2336 (plasmid) [Deinococcus proteolyticus MRP]|uniref:DUF7380 domain-containing protein n=2 Tax=Deinococcus proteolyticus TaxID=55148 RepID=F0RQA2_DEIPM|nr:hypothetical protein Deipr_2336 [Deinococcus proteolyticus MRP]